MEYKLKKVWELANHLTFIEANGSNMPWATNEEDSLIFNVIELLPGWMSRWLEGRMSIAAILANTPEVVEAMLDRDLASILAIYELHHFEIPEVEEVNAEQDDTCQ